MARRPTSADVAHAAGVSRTTVSFVLNRRTDVKIPDETRERVLAAAAQLGYHPHAPARQLAHGRSHILALVMRQTPEQVARKTVERVRRHFGAQKVATAEVPVIFEPTLAADLVSDIFGAVRGEAIYLRRSFLAEQLGKKVAAAVLSWRAGDGFANANPQPPPLFLTSTLPGIWRPTASGTGGPFAKLGDVEPFGLLTSTQFLPASFPQLETARYAADFNEVKSEGKRPAGYPTPMGGFSERQQIALTWAGGAGTAHANVTNPFRLWSNVARDVAQAEGLSLTQTARLFALMTTSMHDSVQSSQTSKFIYMLWRPETAIANADVDNNAATDADTAWAPLLTTPPYPSHSSNMQCIGAGAAGALRNVFRGEKVFTATWYESDTVTPPATTPPVERSRAYGSFMELAVEEGNSRVWGGIHFRFELDTSIVACTNVANYIYDNYMLPNAHGHW